MKPVKQMIFERTQRKGMKLWWDKRIFIAYFHIGKEQGSTRTDFHISQYKGYNMRGLYICLST